MQDNEISNMLVAQLQSENPETRREAVCAASLRALPGTKVPLYLTLKDSHPEVRTMAAHALVVFPEPQTVRAVLELLNDSRWLVREAAVTTLSAIGDQTAVRPLVRLVRNSLAQGLNTPRQAETTAKSLTVLSKLGGHRAVKLLSWVLERGLKPAARNCLSLNLKYGKLPPWAWRPWISQ